MWCSWASNSWSIYLIHHTHLVFFWYHGFNHFRPLNILNWFFFFCWESILHNQNAYHMIMWYALTFHMKQTKYYIMWYASNYGICVGPRCFSQTPILSPHIVWNHFDIMWPLLCSMLNILCLNQDSWTMIYHCIPEAIIHWTCVMSKMDVLAWWISVWTKNQSLLPNYDIWLAGSILNLAPIACIKRHASQKSQK